MLDEKSGQPLYVQLVQLLEDKILTSMSPNEKLQSERELTQVYGVSRITVRLAMQELEKRGLVYKKHGKGTYVSEIAEPAVDLSAAYSFTEQMKKMGKHPETYILSFRKMDASDYLSQQLQIKMGDPVYELERLRLADDLPLMLERSYIPLAPFEGLSEELLKQKPLYEVFAENYQQKIRLAEEEFYASIALENEAALLQIQTGSAVLHIIRKTYNERNRMIEFTFSIARADHFRYKIRHQRGDTD